MTSTATAAACSKPATADQEFSLVLGGPLFQLWRRLRLSDDALHLLHRRVLVLALLAWLPLLLLSAYEGTATGKVAVPFLHDVETHVRFLVVVPVLVIAELLVHIRLRTFRHEFIALDLVPAEQRARFAAAIDSARRLRNSPAIEVALLALVYVVGIHIVWREHTALQAASWYATPGPGGQVLSSAGLWLGYVSLPLFQFLLFRWYFRLVIWARLLWQVSRLDLRLVASHPDGAGGLGFLELTILAFAPLAFAHGALFAGSTLDRILYAGASLPEYRYEIVALLLFVFAFALGPFLSFMPHLRRTRLQGIVAYGALAQRYVRQFEDKWLRGQRAPDEALVGSADIQSLADLNSSVEAVHAMRLVPFSRGPVLQIAVAVLLPIAPLLLTMMPLDKLLERLAGILF